MNTSKLTRWRVRNTAPRIRRKGFHPRIIRTTLHAAQTAMEQADPKHSGFRVGCVVGINGTIFPYGSNYEFGGGYGKGATNAAHAEFTAIEYARHEMRDGDDITVGLVSDSRLPISPCGSCLDVLTTYLKPDTVFALAGSNGEVKLVTLEDLFPTDFELSEVSKLSARERTVLREAREGYGKSVSFDPKQRAVAIIANARRSFVGVHRSQFAYHPKTATAAATSVFLSLGGKQANTFVFMCANRHISGEERQDTFEFFDDLGIVDSARVIIKCPESSEVVVTTPQALLPYSFGKSHLEAA